MTKRMSDSLNRWTGYEGFNYSDTDCVFVGFEYEIIKYSEAINQSIDIDLFCVQLDEKHKCHDIGKLCFYGNMGDTETAPIEALHSIFGSFPWRYEESEGDDDGLWIDFKLVPLDTHYILVVAACYEYIGRIDSNFTVRIWHADKKGKYGHGLIKDLDRITMPCSFEDNKVLSILEFSRNENKWILAPTNQKTHLTVLEFLAGIGLNVE